MMDRTFLERLTANTPLKEDVVEIVAEALRPTILEMLQEGEEVNIYGIGKFFAKDKPARKAKNPRTGEDVDVPASRYLSFKVSKQAHESLDYGDVPSPETSSETEETPPPLPPTAKSQETPPPPPVPASVPNVTVHYLDKNNQQQTVPLSEAKGKVTSKTLAWIPGMGEWKAAKEIETIAPHIKRRQTAKAS